MNKKETTLVVSILFLALVLIVGVFALSSSPKEDSKPAASTAEHDGMNSGSSNTETTNTTDAEDLTNQSEVTIDIKDFKYSKPDIKIKKGTKVTWTNQDTIQHNVMLDHEGAGAPHDPPKPNEVDPNVLAGPLLAKGESYSFTFNDVKSNPYHCSPHPFMKGSVTIVE